MTSDLDTDALARVLSQLSGDLVLVIDAQGLVLSVATGQATPAVAGTEGWEGRPGPTR
jgi:sensor domain CHASE-containing protein